ncbi:MAG: biosynthetic-type acetolactate synthase large subunit [Christensenellales bacterium]
MKQTGAQILIESLISQGVDTVFGYPGGAVLNIYDALYEKQKEIRHILASHEQGAAHAADGYARSTGKTGVVIATSGPGATNLVTGIATAYLDSVPLVAITGNVTRDLIGRDSFQEVDIVSVTNPVVKHNYLVQDAKDLPDIVAQAFEIANSGRKGPVLIDIPKDVTIQQVEYEPKPRFAPRKAPSPPDVQLQAVHEAILKSKRPAIFAGGGVTFSDSARLLREYAKKAQIPVCTSMTGLSSMACNDPLNLGLVGMHGTATANMVMCKCDLLLAIGARFSDRVAGNRQAFAQEATTIQIDIDAAEFDKNIKVDIALQGSAQDCLQQLLDLTDGMDHDMWLHEILRHKALNALPVAENEGDAVNPRHVIRTLGEMAGEDAIIATDVGQHQMLVAQYYPFLRPRSLLSSCGFGTMGYGMGAAVGASVGNPGKRVVLITGDGSFHMNMAELAVAVSNDLPIVILVMNNGVLGMVHQWQKLFYGGRYSNTEINRRTDYVKLAQAFGAEGYRIEKSADIRPVLEQALKCESPCVIDCMISPQERVFPIVPPGAGMKDMIYHEE